MLFLSVSSVVHFCHDHIDVVQHDVCVVRGEGQGRSDPDGVVTAASKVNSSLLQTVKDFISGLGILDINCTKSSQAARPRENFRESRLQLGEAPEDGAPCLVNALQQTLLADSLDHLQMEVNIGRQSIIGRLCAI